MLGPTYGWRARLGLILPSLNVVTEPEYYRMVPEGVTIHTTRMGLEKNVPEDYEHMFDDLPRAVTLLSHARVNALAFACTSGSLYRGLGFDESIIETMKQYINCPCTTTSTSVVNAIKTLGMKKVCVGSPYPKWVNQLVQKFLEDHGYQVVNIIGFREEFEETYGFDLPDLNRPQARGFANTVPAERAYSFVVNKVYRQECDGIFLSCMGFRTLGIIPLLEKDLGKPVTSSNQSTLWQLLNIVGIDTSESMSCFGSLFTH